MKKTTTIIAVLAIILIVSAYFITKPSDNYAINNTNKPVSNVALPNNTPEETLPVTDNTNVEKVYTDAIEILPTMDSVSTAKNQVWTGVFQLVWNDLTNELNKAPIQFAGSQPKMVNLLNKSPFSVKDLSENAYYKKWGLVSAQLKQEIEQGIWTKFHEKSQILDIFDWTPAPNKYLLYAMLKKDLEYVEKFDELGDGNFKASKTPVKYFGVMAGNSSKLKESVSVLFYNDDKDFAVTLKSKQGDLIHLYRTDGQKTLAEMYAEMKQKPNAEKDYLRAEDKFKAPILDFNTQREFKELYNREIIPSGFIIVKAIEDIQFKMNEIGAKLIAEAAIGYKALGITIVDTNARYFYFTGPYAIFMEEPGKQPYFAAYITDPAPLQK